MWSVAVVKKNDKTEEEQGTVRAEVCHEIFARHEVVVGARKFHITRRNRRLGR